MTVEQAKVIDIVGVDKDHKKILLIITDHLDWKNNDIKHIYILQEKINSYLAYIESGEIYEKYPKCINAEKIIEVIAKYPFNKEAIDFLEKVKVVVEGAGFGFSYKTDITSRIDEVTGMETGDSTKIDSISIDGKTNSVMLTIIDSDEWEQKSHLYMLQEKINKYLTFVESGSVLEKYPQSNGRKIVIEIIAKYTPDEKAQDFLNQVKTIIEGAGFGFEVKAPENKD